MLPSSSVAMITYNGERFLQHQLDSLAEQTVLPDELVVCDDGSTDKTMEILHRFAQTAPFPVRIYQNEKNLGVCDNFRKVFFLCEKEVTFFCDQDDVWFPQKLEKVLKIMELESDVGMVVTYDLRIDEHGRPIHRRSHDEHVTPFLLRENSFRTLLSRKRFAWAAHNIACRTSYREMLFEKDFSPYSFDRWIFQVMGVMSQVRTIPEPCCAFRRHGGNVTSRSRGKKNPFVLLYRAIQRRQDVGNLYGEYKIWRQVITFLEKKKECQYPDGQILYQEIANHLRMRIEVITHPWKRLFLLAREGCIRRYFRHSKGLRDILSDLLAWPQKLPEGLRREELPSSSELF
ncbi:MAG: glycosyltransferase [Planctomycetia bacterium]|nr:glycosyltransferase [Planctomycetia bacterium]